jgi:hypothetical protein
LKFIFHQLWQGQTEAVLNYLRTVVKTKNPEKLSELIGHIEKHQSESIDYRRRQRSGKIIGSGRIEKCCDQVIGHRQKKKGMSWSKIGSGSLGILKVVELNNQWRKLWFSNGAANDPDINGIHPVLAILAFVHFFEPFWIFFRLPWQGRYCLQAAHDRRSPEL